MSIETMREGIARAFAPDEWKELAYQAILDTAGVMEKFTVENVWNMLEARGQDADRMYGLALGGVMQRAARAGVIEATSERGAYSPRPQHHRQLTVWRTL